MRLTPSLCFFTILFSSWTLTASAETLELKDGQKIETEIISFSDTSVTIKNNNQTRTISNDDIATINGRSLTADLTTIGLQNREESPKKPGSIFANLIPKNDKGPWITNLQKSFGNQINALLPKLSQNRKTPEWFLPAAVSLSIALYLFLFLPYCMMAEKIGLSIGWQILTIIPVFQLIAWVKIAGKPLWWSFLLLIPVVNIAVLVILYCGMAERCVKNSILGILILIPVANLFLPWYLALNAKRAGEIKPTTPTGKPLPPKRYAITPFEDESQKP